MGEARDSRLPAMHGTISHQEELSHIPHVFLVLSKPFYNYLSPEPNSILYEKCNFSYGECSINGNKQVRLGEKSHYSLEFVEKMSIFVGL